MAIEAEVNEEAKVVISTVRGSLEVEDITDYFVRVWSGDRYPGYSELFDMRGMVGSELSLQSLRSIAGASHALIGADGNVKLALVPKPDGVKSANAYKAFREMRSASHADIRVFDDIREARRWLGLPQAD